MTTTNNELPAAIEKALRRAYQLGQTHWRQADSEYRSHWKRAEETQAKFDALVVETLASVTDFRQPAMPADAGLDQATPFLQEEDQHDLHRFIETTEDDQSYDIGKDRIKRLADLGVVSNQGFGRYSVTAFGYWAHERYWHQNPSLPLRTIDERNAETAKSVRRRIERVGHA